MADLQSGFLCLSNTIFFLSYSTGAPLLCAFPRQQPPESRPPPAPRSRCATTATRPSVPHLRFASCHQPADTHVASGGLGNKIFSLPAAGGSQNNFGGGCAHIPVAGVECSTPLLNSRETGQRNQDYWGRGGEGQAVQTPWQSPKLCFLTRPH